MPQNNQGALWNALNSAGHLAGRFLSGHRGRVAFAGLIQGSSLDGRAEELRGRSVLLTTTDQFRTALALIELDGIARRLVLAPPDLSLEHVALVSESANVDAIVSGNASVADTLGVDCHVPCTPNIVPANYGRCDPLQTEWILLTSGTTGLPKLVAHTLASLSGAIEPSPASPSVPVWSTFYDIRRYGGLQIFLRAVLGGGSLVLSDATETTDQFLNRAAAQGVTNISGTPSHWRRALMSPAAHRITPQYVRLSGEIADQQILDQLASFYPQAKVAHAFASTEAGVAFAVDDGRAGFPSSLSGRSKDGVDLKVEDGSLRIRSTRTAGSYLGHGAPVLRDADGFVDTGDMVELSGDRYYFAGRRDGTINVGGLKVHPEEVETVINRHPQVQMSLVRTRKSPITGALVVADVVLKAAQDIADGQTDRIAGELLQLCSSTLPRHKVPAAIHFVSALAIGTAGKIARQYA